MSHEIYAGFAKRLTQLCEERELPVHGRQAALARVCGIKPPSVNKWFNAISLPGAENLIALAEWGKTTTDWLLTGRGIKDATTTVQPPPAQFELVWVNDDEENVLTQYRQCTDSGKHLVKTTLQHAERDATKMRAVG